MTLPIRNLRLRLSQGQIFWREVGQGKTLVFLHGSWSDGNQWLPMIEALSGHYHCVIPDLLGFGESEQPKLHYSIELQVECLAEYLEALKLRQIYLVGESLGGWIAASYALRFPDQIKGLVLLSPEGIPIGAGGWQWERWLVSQPPLAYWLLKFMLPFARLLKHQQQIEQLLQRRQQLRRSPVACKLLFQRRRAEIQAEWLHERLQWLKLPVLLLQGQERDRAPLTLGSADQWSQISQAESHLLPGMIPDLLVSSPDQIAEPIQAFVQRVSYSSME
jgi:pimeloyl-ACP methyl ester carboxylesterase